MGDEIMALFGAPRAHENDPERALRAALEMRQAIGGFNRERRVPLEIHFGVNTGLVYAGDVGGGGRRDYSVMGDAVNIASRLIWQRRGGYWQPCDQQRLRRGANTGPLQLSPTPSALTTSWTPRRRPHPDEVSPLRHGGPGDG